MSWSDEGRDEGAVGEVPRCSCRLPVGWWSFGGWHFRRIGPAEGKGPSYVGLPIAVEPCPLHVALIERQRSDRLALEAGENVSRRGRLRA